MNRSLPGSSVHGILQARILEWVFPSLGHLLDPGIEPGSPALQTDSLPTESIGKPSEDRKEANVRRQKGESPWIENRDA